MTMPVSCHSDSTGQMLFMLPNQQYPEYLKALSSRLHPDLFLTLAIHKLHTYLLSSIECAVSSTLITGDKLRGWDAGESDLDAAVPGIQQRLSSTLWMRLRITCLPWTLLTWYLSLRTIWLHLVVACFHFLQLLHLQRYPLMS